MLYRLTHGGDTLFSKYFLHPDFGSTEANFVGDFHISQMALDSIGNIYVVGQEQRILGNKTKIFLAKHSADGSRLWIDIYERAQSSQGLSLLVDGNEIYVAAKDVGGNETPVLFKFNLNGILHNIDELNNVDFSDSKLIHFAGSNYMYGLLWLNGASSYRPYIAKIDENGDMGTPILYGNPSLRYEHISAVIDSLGYLWLMSLEYTSAAVQQNILFRIDTNAIVQSQYYIQGLDGNNTYTAQGLTAYPNGNLAIMGIKNYINNTLGQNLIYASSMYLQQISATADIIWEKEYSGMGKKIMAQQGDSLLVIGSRGIEYTHALFMRTDAAGETHVCKPDFWTSYYSPNYNDTTVVSAVFYMVNESFGTGPFSWKINGVDYSSDFNTYYYSVDTGLLSISLIGCGDSVTENIYLIPVNLGVDKKISQEAVKIYPVPCDDVLVIEIMDGEFGQATFLLHDFSGKAVLSTQFASTTHIDVSKLSSGIYFYSLRLADGSDAKGKLIKK
jgi:hypothetical protein